MNGIDHREPIEQYTLWYNEQAGHYEFTVESARTPWHPAGGGDVEYTVLGEGETRREAVNDAIEHSESVPWFPSADHEKSDDGTE